MSTAGSPGKRLSGIRLRRIVRVLGIGLLALLLIVLLAGTSILATESGSRWVLGRVSTLVNNLPDQQLSLAVSGGTLSGGLTLENLTYSGPAVQVSVERAEINWNPLALLSARVAISSIVVDNTLVDILATEAEPDPGPRPAGPLISFAPLPVAISIDELTLNGLRLRQPDQEFQIDRLALTASLEGQSLDVSELQIDSELASVSGALALILRDNLPLTADLRWRYPDSLFPDAGPATGNLLVEGDLGSIDIAHQLEQPFRLSSNGQIDPGLTGNELAIDFRHTSDSLTLALEQTGEIRLGDLALATTGGVQQLQLSLTTAITGERLPPAQLSAEASWQDGELGISDFTLTTETGRIDAVATLNFADGFSGSLQYQLTDSAPLDYYRYVGSPDSTENLPIAIANLRSSGSLELGSDDDGLSARLQLQELGGEFGDYPFTSSGQISFNNGELQIDGLRLSTTDNQLLVDGTLADNLDFAWQINAPRLDQFLAGLEGQLSASGDLSGTLENLQVNSVAELDAARYSGAAVESLRLNVSLQDNVIDGRLTVSDASFQSGERRDQLDNLTLQINGSESMHQASLVAQSSFGDLELLLQGGFADLASMTWNGELTSGQLDTLIGEWRTRSATGIAVNDLAGGYLVEIEESCWLQASASLCLAFSAGNETTGSVIGVVGRLRAYPLSVLNHPNNRPEQQSFQLDVIPQLPEAIELGGTIDGDFLVTLDPSRTPAVEASVQPRDLALTVITDDPAGQEQADLPPVTEETTGRNTADGTEQRRIRHSYLLLEPTLTANLAEGRWDVLANTGLGRQALAGTPPETGGGLDSQLSMAADGSLAGSARLDLDDIGWLSELLPDSGNAAGQLTGDLSISGSLTTPVFDIAINLSDGLAEIPQLGIALTDINTRIDSLQNGPVEITLGARSGQGSLQLQGNLVEPYSSDRHLEASLSGQNFRLADIPDLGLEVSPSLQVSASDQRIQVTGDLDIPVLNFTLRELPEQAVDVSRDAIIVNHPSDRPELARSLAAEQGTLFNVPIVADIDINLGDDVSLNGFGFTSQVAGNLNVRQQANGTNLTYGELEIVRGDYQMYGQSLQIRGGKLLFFGASDNPALDIRATRTVEGTTVGVLMNGTVKNIRSQLFSTPALPDSDIIAIMATGKPFSEIGQGEGDRDAMLGSIARLGLNRSQGLTNQVREQLGLDTLAITNTGSINNTTLTVGKFITPDIFLRYGIGLFDQQSKLALDYTLTEHITLQAETGEYQSVDVIYRVER